MVNIENISIVDSPTDEKQLEYLSSDGAWYDIKLLRQGDQLIVKYQALPSAFEEVFDPGKFKAVEDVNKFRDKFRPCSRQVQDNECLKIIPGLKICASLSFDGNDLRFYDAKVAEVYRKEHTFRNGVEQCWCTFTLIWLGGPNTGTSTTASLDNICFLQDGPLDKALVDFVRMSRMKVTNSLKSSRDVGLIVSNIVHESTQGNEVSQHKLQNTSQELKDPKHVKSVADMNQCLQGRCAYELAIENMEKDISASTVKEFIHRETSVSPEVHILPSLRTGSFSQGVLKVHTEKEFSKLLEFIENPNHIIVSSSMRPWVVTERFVPQDDKSLLGNTVPIMEYCHSRGCNSEPSVIYPGADGYILAKELKDNLTEFNRGQKHLLTRLASEEEKIIRQASRSRKRCRT